MEIKKPTDAECFALVTMELRRHGFRCDDPQDSKDKNGVLRKFANEPATGMAAFTQSVVYASIRMWKPGDNEPPSERSVEARIGYDHHRGGSNGITLDAIVWRDILGGECRIVWHKDRRNTDEFYSHHKIVRESAINA